MRQSVAMRAVLIAAACMVGCYGPQYRDCEVSCASNVCPSGLECREGMCRVGGMTGACSEVQPDATSTGPIPLDQVAGEQLRALCSWMVRCGEYEDVPTCEDALGGAQDAIANLTQGVAAGKIRYDGAKARECIDAFAQSTCDRANAFSNRVTSPSCLQTFTGTVGDTGACYFDEECISQVCNVPSCNMACCPGSCVGGTPPGRPTIGQHCVSKDRCVDSYCAGVGTPNATCTAFKGNSAVCTSSEECMPGLACVTQGTSRTCQPLQPTLGACMSTNDCAQLADTCRAGKCQTGGLTGTACTSIDECQQQHPCDPTTMKCTVLAGIGESCAGYPQCRDGYCDAQGFCRAKTPNGGPCDAATGSSRCESDYCDTANGMCVAKPVCI